MKIPGIHILKKAERKGNQVELPKTERLGLVQFFKLTFKEVKEDRTRAYAGNLTYQALSAIFPFFTFLLSLLGLFNATELVNTMLNRLSGVLPESATVFVDEQIIPITETQADRAFTVVAIVSLLLALWGSRGRSARSWRR